MSLHVVFGTGPVGRATARALIQRGHEVRLVNRRGRSGIARDTDTDDWDQLEIVSGDATDTGFTARAARGAAAVYQTLNPPYHRWAEDFPALQRGALAAAESAEARYVGMDNVYAYGHPAGRVLNERSAENPSTRKGKVRLRMATDVWEAHSAGRVEAVSGRASDYYGPGGGAASPLGERVLEAALNGKKAMLFGNPDLLHSYTYIPDIGTGLAILGTTDGVTGRSWHLPNDPNPWTSRAMTLELFRQAGTTPRIGRVSVATVRIMGMFNPTMRELVEMAYEFEQPFIVDSHDITTLGAHATPIAQALTETLDAHRARTTARP